jgi:hypothetical protein
VLRGDVAHANGQALGDLSAYHRLKAAITRLDLLALQQTEWEEAMTRKQIVIQEH